MSMNPRCPRCGGLHTQLTNEWHHHGCLWTILFGVWYLLLIFVKWMIGIVLLFCLDWWMAILKALFGKGYVWKSKRWFEHTVRTFYCHDCGCNFHG